MDDDRLAPYFGDIGPYLRYLEAQGLHISRNSLSRHSIQKAFHYIPRVGIQRFHNYFVDLKPILAANPSATIGIDDVLRLYKFDRKLRLLALDAIERIEVATKNYISMELEKVYGQNFLALIHAGDFKAFDLTTSGKTNSTFSIAEIIASSSKDVKQITRSIAKNALRSPENRLEDHSQSVEDVIQKIDSRIIVDAMSIGQASRLFHFLGQPHQEKIARNYGANPEYFEEWLYRMTVVRNIAAHHARLWNVTYRNELRIPGIIHADFRREAVPSSSRVRFYSTAIILYHCLKKVARRTRWHWGLQSLLDSKSLTPECLDIAEAMGFRKDWNHLEFWKGASNGGT